MSSRCLCGTLLFAALALPPMSASADDRDATHRYFQLPLEVTGVEAPGTPLSLNLDFTDLLARLQVRGAVDEHSLDLRQVLADGRETAVPVQFSAAAQPVKARALLPGTSPQVSYVAETSAAEIPPVRVTGVLAWLAGQPTDGKLRYRLRFGVLRAGRAIQVPFPPQNLRMFDADNRATPIRDFPAMQIRPQWPLDGGLHLLEDGRPVTSCRLGPRRQRLDGPLGLRRPFLYPVFGPDGSQLTEFGKPHDPTGSHAHHYSLWVAHAKVDGRDFWSEQGGVIAHQRIELLEDGPVFCRLVTGNRWTFPVKAQGSQWLDVLDERRDLTVYRAHGGTRLMDLALEFSPTGSSPVELGKTTFGFLAARVAQSMTPFDGGGEILNARGDRNEQGAHLKRAEWLDQSGPVSSGGTGAARWGGIAILDHPQNPHHPTVWHCRNDGWAGASFCGEEPYTLKPGEKLNLRYRIQLHVGDARHANVAQQYAAWQSQPQIHPGAARSE